MVRWTKRAVADLREIHNHIATDNPDAAKSWIARLRKRALDASRFPNSGRIVPEGARTNVREVLVRTYRIIYRVRPTGISVYRVVEGHKLLTDVDFGSEE